MKYYKLDGSYVTYPRDNEFGWCLQDIVIDEAAPQYNERNQYLKDVAREKRIDARASDNSDEVDYLYVKNSIDLSNIELDHNFWSDLPFHNYWEESIEGLTTDIETHFLKQYENWKIPDKEDLLALITPINPETKALVKVISTSAYRMLDDRDINYQFLKTVNFKATNCRYLRGRLQSEPSLKHNITPEITFELDDSNDDNFHSDLKYYQENQESNMLSLMMEIINSDMDSALDDLSSLEQPSRSDSMETSNDCISLLNEEEVPELPDNQLSASQRTDLLNSIGLSDAIDRSIEQIRSERDEFMKKIQEIRHSFQEDMVRVDKLMHSAVSLQHDLRETTFLSNLINLLNGDLEKVKINRLPFRIFHTLRPSKYKPNQNFIV